MIFLGTLLHLLLNDEKRFFVCHIIVVINSVALIVQTLFHDDGRCHSSITARTVQEKGVPRVMSRLTAPEIKPEAVKFAQFAQTTPPIHLVKPVTPSSNFILTAYSLVIGASYILTAYFLVVSGNQMSLKGGSESLTGCFP